MQKVKVSIIVPVYKVEQFIGRTMDSLLGQTLKDIEIILVDDGSPDNCPAICDRYVYEYPNVRVIHKKNTGLGMACNSGMEIATGEYIAFCDSDDYVDSDMYESMYNAAIENHADVVFTGIKTVNQNGIVSPMNDYPVRQVINQRDKIYQFAMDMIASQPSDATERHVPMSAKVVLYRKALIDEHHLRFVSERELISEDLIWNMDVLCHAACIVTLPKAYYYYYTNSASLSKRVRSDRFAFFKTMRSALFQRAKLYGMPIEIGLRIDRMFIGYCRFYIGMICNSYLSQHEKRSIISEICKDKVWIELWRTYPIRQMPKTHLVILFLMRCNCYFLLAAIYKMRR